MGNRDSDQQQRAIHARQLGNDIRMQIMQSPRISDALVIVNLGEAFNFYSDNINLASASVMIIVRVPIQPSTNIIAIVDESLTESEARALGRTILILPNVSDARFVTYDEAMSNSDDEHEYFNHRYYVYITDNRLISDTISKLEDLFGIVLVKTNK